MTMACVVVAILAVPCFMAGWHCGEVDFAKEACRKGKGKWGLDEGGVAKFRFYSKQEECQQWK